MKLKPTIQVTKQEKVSIVIRIGETEHKMTLDEAQALLSELQAAIGKPVFVPYPVPSAPWSPQPVQPVWIETPQIGWPLPPAIYCKTT